MGADQAGEPAARGKRECQGTTKRGMPCSATPLNEGTLVEGVPATGGYCRSHDPALAAAGVPSVPAGFREFVGPGRPRKPRAIDALKQWIEDHVEETMQPLLDGLRAEKSVVVGNGKDAHIEMVPDIPTRMAAARELYDRGYGRPKQMIDAVVVSDEDLLERLAAMEGELADIGHSGVAGDDPAVPGDEAEAGAGEG